MIYTLSSFVSLCLKATSGHKKCRLASSEPSLSRLLLSCLSFDWSLSYSWAWLWSVSCCSERCCLSILRRCMSSSILSKPVSTASKNSSSGSFECGPSCYRSEDVIFRIRMNQIAALWWIWWKSEWRYWVKDVALTKGTKQEMEWIW